MTTSCSRQAECDLTLQQLTYYCGIRFGEIDTLKIAGVMDENYQVQVEIALVATITKSERARRIFVLLQMHRQL